MGRGRKPVLTLHQKWAVGGECERLWRDLAEQQALEKHHQKPHQRDVKKQQATLQATPLASRESPVWKFEVKHVNAEIKDILSEAGATRFAVIRAKRPYGKRTEVLSAAVKWCAATYGKTISERRAQDCWAAFSAMKRRLERELT